MWFLVVKTVSRSASILDLIPFRSLSSRCHSGHPSPPTGERRNHHCYIQISALIYNHFFINKAKMTVSGFFFLTSLAETCLFSTPLVNCNHGNAASMFQLHRPADQRFCQNKSPHPHGAGGQFYFLPTICQLINQSQGILIKNVKDDPPLLPLTHPP